MYDNVHGIVDGMYYNTYRSIYVLVSFFGLYFLICKQFSQWMVK